MRVIAVVAALALTACTEGRDAAAPTTTSTVVDATTSTSTAPTSNAPAFAAEIGPVDATRLHAS